MHKLIGGTPAQFRTCKAHYLARSVDRPKRRYTGWIRVQATIFVLAISRYSATSLRSHFIPVNSLNSRQLLLDDNLFFLCFVLVIAPFIFGISFIFA